MHVVDIEYGGVLRIRLYDRATIKRGCSTTRVVSVGVTFARRGDEKEEATEWRKERKTGERYTSGNGQRTTLLFSRCYDISGRS